MNRIKYIILIFLGLLNLFSCQKANLEDSNFIENRVPNLWANLKNNQYDNLLLSVDSLNMAYGYTQDQFRGFWDYVYDSKEEAVADYLGGVVGGWLGKRLGGSVGASAGVVTANPVVGVAGYVIGTKAGGAVGGTLGTAAASYAASLVFNSYNQTEGVLEPNLLELNEDTTYGDLHNILIEKIRKNKEIYISKDGNVDVEAIYDDMLKAKKELGLPEDISNSSEYKRNMLSYITEAIRIKKETINSSNLKRNYYLGIRNYIKQHFVIPNSVMGTSEIVMDKLTSTSKDFQNDDNKLKKYSEDFIKVVNESALSLEDKEAISLTGLVSISSNFYWNRVDEEK